MIAVPNDTPITNAESVENHETGRPVSTLPAESRRMLVKAMVSPTTRAALAGCSVTLATEAGVPVTATVIESRSESLVALMVTKPGWRPMTEAVSPTGNSVATAVSLLVHDTAGFTTGLPLASPTAARKVMLPPTPTDVGPEIWMYAPPP